MVSMEEVWLMLLLLWLFLMIEYAQFNPNYAPGTFLLYFNTLSLLTTDIFCESI